MQRIEWIGVKTLSMDERVSFLSLTQKFNELEQATIEAMGIILAPRIRSDGTRERLLRGDAAGGKLGLSKSYKWGPHAGSYVQTVNDNDARIILSCADEYEFKNLDDPAHDGREPIIPPGMIDEVVRKILATASRGDKPSLSSPVYYADAQGVLRDYETRKAQRSG
jgi:hypothetical protein